MRILFLDDDPNRHQIFHSIMGVSPGQTILYTWTAAEAIERLNSEAPFDVACLDHDLGGEQMVMEGGEKGHGLEVARWIADHPWSVERVLVHSYNPAGAKNMVDALEASGVPALYQPFGPMVFKTLLELGHGPA